MTGVQTCALPICPRVLAAFALSFVFVGATPVRSAAASPHAPDVHAILETHCVECHGGEKTKAGLDVTTRAALLRGGESGAAVQPGQPEASLLYRMVTHEEEPGMPHKKDKLPTAEIKTIAAWIGGGVIYARD